MIEIVEAKAPPVPQKPVAQVALDAQGFVTAAHVGTGVNVITPPEGGSLVTVSPDVYAQIDVAFIRGDCAKIEDNKVIAVDPNSLSRTQIKTKPIDLKQLRRNKMRAIGDSSVEGRGRVFKEFPHVHMMDQHRHIDVMVMYMRGKLKDEDKIITRHLKSGEYEDVKVGDLLDEIEKTFWLRQELRKHDQTYRDKINAIFKDPKKSDEQKMAEMEAVAVPPGLGVSTDSTVTKLIVEKK